jgi:hypothetical protein
MTRKNYIIEYTAFDKKGNILIKGKVRAKNKLSEFEAKCSFEDHLKKKHPSFGRLVVHGCQVDFFGSLKEASEHIEKAFFGTDFKNPFGL